MLRWVRSYALEIAMDVEVRGDLIAMAGFYKGVRDLEEAGEAEPVDRTVDPSLQSEMATMLLSAHDGRPVHAWVAPGRGHDAANAVAFLPDVPSLLITGFIQLTADFTGDGETGEGWIVCENLGDLFAAQYRLPERQPERVREPREPLREIALEVSIGERSGSLQASLAWSGAAGGQIDVYRNGQRIATVPNDGSYTDANPRAGGSPPYRYRVCEARGTRCSATRGRSP
jgi:hypothetical protein